MCRTVLLKIFTILFLCIICETNAKISETLMVSLPDGGGITGRYLTSKSGRGIRGFMGIPYAEPPVGPLRFKNPVPKGPWTGFIDARDDSIMCPQPMVFMGGRGAEGKEDCLYLNVYTPLKPKTSDPLPVLVSLHGGGFQVGAGGRPLYGPDYFLDHDVILVSGNYRLGILGFLSTGTKDCPGNFGLRDQTEILKWVKKNIGVFGGDSKKVTIFGESAGGASVTYHMASKLSKGLFEQAISQSGTYFSPWAMSSPEISAAKALKLGRLLNCEFTIKQSDKLIDCLRTKSADDLTLLLPQFYELKYNDDPMVVFGPIVESDSPEAFVTARDIMKPHGSSIPLIIGSTSDEGALKTVPSFSRPDAYQEMTENLDKFLLISLYFDKQDDDNIKKQITSMIKEFYFAGKEITLEEHKQNFTNLYTDGWFMSGINDVLKIRSLENMKSAPTFVYTFAHYGEATLIDIATFFTVQDDFGVCHGDDIMYLFPVLQETLFRSAPTEVDEEIQESLTSMWVNFATTGKPTLKSGNLPKWNEAKKFPIDYLRIGTKYKTSEPLIAMEKEVWEPKRAEFWQKLKSLIPPSVNSKTEL